MLTWFCFLCLHSRSRRENLFHVRPPGQVLWATGAAGWTLPGLVFCHLLGSPSHQMAGWNAELKQISLKPLSLAEWVWQRFCRQSCFQMNLSGGGSLMWLGYQRWRNQGVWKPLVGHTRQHHWRYRIQHKPFWSHHKEEQWETARRKPKRHRGRKKEINRQHWKLPKLWFNFCIWTECGHTGFYNPETKLQL